MLKEEKTVTNFKPGDKVRLKEKFYNETRFLEMDRGSRKYYAALKGKPLIVSKAQTCFLGDYVLVSGISTGWLRTELLEPVEKPRPQITGVWFDEATDAFAARKAMRKWTLEEIIEAQAFLGEFFTRGRCRLSYKDYAHSIRGEEILITVDGKRGVAKCCPTDDWNYYIGSMVALSKITGRRLPSWIRSTK